MSGASYSLVVGPAVEPVDVAEVKQHLRIDHAEDDLWLRAAIVAVREKMENFLGRGLITQTWEATWATWPGGDEIELWPAPLRSVVSVKYVDAAGVEGTMAAGGYAVDTRGQLGRVLLRSGVSWPWPAGGLAVANGVVARYVVGYGDKGRDVPQIIRSAMLLWAGDLYENRETVVVGASATKLPPMVEQALWGWRVF